MKAKKPDTYQKWIHNNQIDEVLEFIKECSRKLVTQREMCGYLGINETTFIKLRKKYPLIDESMSKAKTDLKKDLVGALYKRAVGFEVIDEDQIIEDGGKGKPPKRKITKTKRYVAPDRASCIYLLTKHFGKEFSDKKEELEIMEKRLELVKEEWKNECSN